MLTALEENIFRVGLRVGLNHCIYGLLLINAELSYTKILVHLAIKVTHIYSLGKDCQGYGRTHKRLWGSL